MESWTGIRAITIVLVLLIIGLVYECDKDKKTAISQNKQTVTTTKSSILENMTEYELINELVELKPGLSYDVDVWKQALEIYKILAKKDKESYDKSVIRWNKKIQKYYRKRKIQYRKDRNQAIKFEKNEDYLKACGIWARIVKEYNKKQDKIRMKICYNLFNKEKL